MKSCSSLTLISHSNTRDSTPSGLDKVIHAFLLLLLKCTHWSEIYDHKHICGIAIPCFYFNSTMTLQHSQQQRKHFLCSHNQKPPHFKAITGHQISYFCVPGADHLKWTDILLRGNHATLMHSDKSKKKASTLCLCWSYICSIRYHFVIQAVQGRIC